MKYNIILILAVSVVSIAIIIISVALSLGGSESSQPEQDSSVTSVTTSQTEQTEPTQTTTAATTSATTESELESEPEPTSDPGNDPGNDPGSDSETSHPDHSEVIDGIITTATALIGTDFADGGDTPEGFDNSGFIYYVLRENGYLSCPRGVSAQAAMGTLLEYDQLKRGDLVYFYGEGTTTAGFGGIYCGDGIMIACLMPGTKVKEVDITTNYYRTNFCNGVSLS